MRNKLRELRKSNRMTQDELATRINATKRQVGAWERGDNDLPMDYAYAIADVFCCSIDDLVGRVSYAVVDVSADMHLTADERELVKCFRLLNDEQRKMYGDMMRYFAYRESVRGDRE